MSRKGTKVYLNVYDLSNNEYYYPMGLGFYHSGIEVLGAEYTFSQSGCFQQPQARVASPAVYRETILLGETLLNYREIESAFDEVSSAFHGTSYHVMQKNCNNFAEAFTIKLVKGVSFPSWVNRMATVGNYFSCLLPRDMNDPKNNGDQEIKESFSAFSGGGKRLSTVNDNIQHSELEDVRENDSEMREKLLQATLKRFGK
jgi:hypothetical protein